MRGWTPVILFLALLGMPVPAPALTLDVRAPAALAAFAERLRALDREPLESALADAGLEAPAIVRVELIPADDARARDTPPWIVGLAFGTEDVVIFPDRVGSYPYDSLESVLRHEVVHLSLSSRAGGEALPRWFHEGVAVSVESGWDIVGGTRLLLAAMSNSGLDDIGRLFATDSQLGNADAYLLATAIVADVRDRHGAAVPGAIANRVATGVPFERAFEIETGETPQVAAARAWAGYRRWTTWLPTITSGSAVWTGILLLAIAAFVAQRRRRARRRRQWDEEDALFRRPLG